MAENVAGSNRTHEYELGHTDRELKRLGAQAQLVDPMTHADTFALLSNGM